ncbi:hypothetical protein, partial [Pseudovibrio flavus]|uniref:hypothetical protein n=1 Tax=Pseudovibrio flavus TaxID=2529854 RepID=UPI00211BC377
MDAYVAIDRANLSAAYPAANQKRRPFYGLMSLSAAYPAANWASRCSRLFGVLSAAYPAAN